MRIFYFLIFFTLLLACNSDDDPAIVDDVFQLQSVQVGTTVIRQDQVVENLPVDRAIFSSFNLRVDRASVPGNLTIKDESGEEIDLMFNYLNDDKTISAVPQASLSNNTTYTITFGPIRAVTGEVFPGSSYSFKTEMGSFSLETVVVDAVDMKAPNRIQNIAQEWEIIAHFSEPLNPSTNFKDFFQVNGKGGTMPLSFNLSEDQMSLSIIPEGASLPLSRYQFSISQEFKSEQSLSFSGFSKEFYTAVDSTFKFPEIPDEDLLTLVQEQTFKYFSDFAHPASGMARERNTSGNLVTVGGSGFGVMALLVGIERGFISREEGVAQLEKIVGFLQKADRFHGVWPHWLDGNTGKVIPFSDFDNGGDLVETAFMIQGLLTARQYLNPGHTQEAAIIATITQLWEEVEWDWYTKGGENTLYWHWSPNFGWEMNHQIRGWNESLIVYVLAASSPTHSINSQVYENGWAQNGGMSNENDFYNINLPLGENFGGPLFFAHYSFLGLDPRNLEDKYANYWEQNVNHSLINQLHAEVNPNNFVGYGAASWGFTASDNHEGYSAHSPTNDLGVITPTAALSSIPYTPEESMAAIRHFYYLLGDRLWGDYGFYDAINPTEEWVAESYLAIDQGPIIIMIENHRTALLWDLFMSDPEVIAGLNLLGFTSY